MYYEGNNLERYILSETLASHETACVGTAGEPRPSSNTWPPMSYILPNPRPDSRTDGNSHREFRSFAINILRANGVENVAHELYKNVLNFDNALAYRVT